MVTAMTLDLKEHLKKRESIMGFFIGKGEDQSMRMKSQIENEKKSQLIHDKIAILAKKLKVSDELN